MVRSAFQYTHRVVYSECTIGNHIYYSRYLDILEAARGEFFRHIGSPLRQLQETGCIFPVIGVEASYKSPARYDDEIVIETRVTALRSHVIKFGYRLARLTPDGEQLLAEAETVHVSVDKNMRKRSLPEKYIIAIRATMT